ncbi:MAG: hypothetical protein RKE49_15675 [Oceanicaulis sp.]
MNIKLIPSLVMFLGSYLPLSVILLMQDFRFEFLDDNFCRLTEIQNCHMPFDHPWVSIGMVAICSICFSSFWILISNHRLNEDIILNRFEVVQPELLNYTLPYVVAFINLDYSDHSAFLGFLVFLVWMFWLTHSSGQIALNPLLSTIGWRLCRIRYQFNSQGDEYTSYAICRGSLDQYGSVRVARIQEAFIIRTSGKRANELGIAKAVSVRSQ